MQGDVEEQPSVVLVRTAGTGWPPFGCIFHMATPLSFRTSFPGGAEWYRRIRCSEETVEWRSVTLLDTDGSESLEITKPFSALQIFNNSLYISFWILCWHFHLPDSPGHKQIWNVAMRLWIVHFTWVNTSPLMGEGGSDDSLIDQRLFVVFLWHMERGRQGPSAVIWFTKDLGKRTGFFSIENYNWNNNFTFNLIVIGTTNGKKNVRKNMGCNHFCTILLLLKCSLLMDFQDYLNTY